MDKKVFSKCGMRCDLCLIYRPNVEKEDRRAEICNAWKKIWQGFSPDPNTVICDGCCSEEANAVLFSPDCTARKCVIEKGVTHCGYCNQYPCEIFPAEPSEEETIQKIEVEKQWTWDDEKLMEAYACKKYMDEFRRQRDEMSHMKYKMVAVDLDDTILHKDKAISEYTKSVFEKLSGENVKIVVATSRAIQRAEEYAKQLHASALVSLNGAVVYDAGTLIKTTPIPEEVVRNILSELSQVTPIELSIVKPDVVYTTDKYFIDRGESLPIDLADYDANEVQRIYATTPNHEVLHTLPLEQMGLKLIQSQPKNYPDFHTIVRKEVNKAEGLKLLCERFAILPEEVVAFGDEDNDFEMIQFAGCGVAMGNAIDALKAQASDVTVTNEEDGVARWIETHWDFFEVK